MRICNTCERESECPVAHEDDFCLNFVRKPQTNADRIRAMSDEELAIAILKHKCESCDWVGFCKTWDECKADLVKWLKEEAEPGAKL